MIIGILVFLIGLTLGSFVGAFAWRYPRGVSIVSNKHSFCESCKKNLNGYDNIPLFSYLLLGGKCRFCKKPISFLTFVVELSGGLFAVLCYVYFGVSWLMIVAILVAFILLAILIIDLETMIIPDGLVWSLFALALIWPVEHLYTSVLVGLVLAVFLLMLHLATGGKGMGLGDVKLVIPLGFLLGNPAGIYFLWLAFIIGALYAIVALAVGGKKLKSKVPFAPFIIVAFYIFWFKGAWLMPVIANWLKL